MILLIEKEGHRAEQFKEQLLKEDSTIVRKDDIVAARAFLRTSAGATCTKVCVNGATMATVVFLEHVGAGLSKQRAVA